MRPSIDELRAVAQPPGLLERRSAEHWAGRLYMRRISLHTTRLLASTRITPNALTLAMIVVGLIAAGMLSLPGIWLALAAAVGVQVYLLLDCVDGELARWRRITSAAGVYLDRLGHHVVEAALVVALGVRAAGGPTAPIDGWMLLGALTAVVVIIGKLETDLVMVARAGAGLAPKDHGSATSRVATVRTARRAVALLPVHRMVGAVELSLLVVVAAVFDTAVGGLVATRSLLAAAALVGLIVAVGHPITILTSERLK